MGVSTEEIKKIVQENDQLGSLLGIELVEVQEGSARAKLVIEKKHLNAANCAHGGTIFTLADIALAAASNSYGELALLSNGNLTVIHASFVGDVLTAVAKEISKSRKLAHYRINVTNQKEAMIAVYTATVYRKGTSLT